MAKAVNLMVNIPNTSLPVKPAESAEPEKEIHLSKAGWRFYDLLSGIRNLYRKENKLQPDGSFFKENEFFEKRLGVSRWWVKCLKKILKEKGLINYIVKPGRGNATSYWIIDRPQKNGLETSQPARERQPLDPKTIWAEAQSRGKEPTLETWLRFGYSREEILACFEG